MARKYSKKEEKKTSNKNRSPVTTSRENRQTEMVRLPEGFGKNRGVRPQQQAAILQFQQQRGNSRVQSILSNARVHRARRPESQSVVQRGNGHGDERREASRGTDPGNVTLNIGEIRLQPLWEYPIHITTPAVMNQSAADLLLQLRQAASQSTNLRSELGYLEYAGGTGRSDLTAVQGARGRLGRQARGRAGEYLRTAIERYTSANGNVRAELSNVREKQIGIREAASRLLRVTLAGRVLTTGREVTRARGEVARITANVARAKSLAQGLIDPAISLLQGKWADAGINLAKFVGKEIVGAAVDAVYAPDLQRAQAQLRQAQTELENFEDERQAAHLQEAALGLQRANQASNTAQLRLITIARQAEEAETTLTEELRRMGLSEAADALDARATTMEASARTLQGLITYQNLITSIKRRSGGLGNLNRMLANLMISAGGERVVPNSEHRNEMYAAADQNATVLGRVATWAEHEIVTISTARGFVEGESYLSSYNQIDTALHEALVTR